MILLLADLKANEKPRHLRGFLLKKHSPEIHQQRPSTYLTTLQKLTIGQVILKGSRGIPLQHISLKTIPPKDKTNEHSNFRSSSSRH